MHAGYDVSDKGRKTLAARTCYQVLHIISSAWLTSIIRLHINCNEYSSTGTNLPLLCASRHHWLPPDPTSHPLTCRMSHDFPAVTPVQNKSFHLHILYSHNFIFPTGASVDWSFMLILWNRLWIQKSTCYLLKRHMAALVAEVGSFLECKEALNV